MMTQNGLGCEDDPAIFSKFVIDVDASYFQGRDLKIKVIEGETQFASAHT